MPVAPLRADNLILLRLKSSEAGVSCSISFSPFSAPAAFSSWPRMQPCATGSEHMLDLILGAVVSAGLLVYLFWALVRPEDF